MRYNLQDKFLTGQPVPHNVVIQNGLVRAERLANDFVLVSSPLKPLTDTSQEVYSGQ